jgi:hypothetical protein
MIMILRPAAMLMLVSLTFSAWGNEVDSVRDGLSNYQERQWAEPRPELNVYLKPGTTPNWDDAMRRDLLVALQEAGINVELACCWPVAHSQDTAAAKTGKAATDAAQAPDSDASTGVVKLSAKNDVWLDIKRKAVVVDGQVCLRAGQLEMFACPKGTKEHESVVALSCLAEEVHAGLLAAGARPGTPVSFQPEYKAATGQIVDVYVLWIDAQGDKRQARAQDWIKHTKSDKPMPYDWVFAGSGFWKDEETGQEHYRANGGDLICVSNFPTAMLDLPIESSQANADLMFEALSDNIPPKGTKVRVVLIPRRPKGSANAAK